MPDALDHVAGYCTIQDLSERDFQRNRGGTWDKGKGKGCDTFGRPWLVTADDVGTLGVEKLGDQRRQVVAYRPNGPAA